MLSERLYEEKEHFSYTLIYLKKCLKMQLIMTCGLFPLKVPKYEVRWVTQNKKEIPFGKLIKID